MRGLYLFKNRRIRLGCGLLAFVLLLGSTGFWLIEQWTPIEALFTAVLVVSTLGFTDLRPSGPAGQVLTMVLIMGGVGALYYLVGALAQTIIEEELDRGQKRRMEQQIERLSDHFIVCGFGRVGRETCRQLAQEHSRFVVIDSSADRIEQVRTTGYLWIRGDAADDAVLQRAHIERARGLLTAVGTDASNVYITLSARALNPGLFIVARAVTEEAEHKLRIAGANRVISPYVLGGRSMAGMALRPMVMDFLDVLVHSDDLEMWLEQIPIVAGSPLDGAPIGETRLREQVGITILAVRRADGQMLVNPGPQIVLGIGDVLIALGSRTNSLPAAQ